MPLVFSPPDRVGAESIQLGRLEAQANQAAAQSSLGFPACARVLQDQWAPATEGELYSNQSSTVRSSPAPHPCPDSLREDQWVQTEKL